VNNLRGAAVVGAVAFLAGAAGMAYHDAPADKVVIIDGWWAKDHAKAACSLALPKTAEEQTGCAISDPDYGYGAVTFLQTVASNMALDPNCRDVTVAYVWSPKSTTPETFALEGKPHKMLIVDYVPGYDQLGWEMNGAIGKGTAKEIASSVCFTMSGNGARLAP
jgi:hypothetical protein